MEVGEVILTSESSMLHSPPKLLYPRGPIPGPAEMDREAWVARVGVEQSSPPPQPSSSCPNLGLSSSLQASPPLGSQSHCLTPNARLCKGARELSTRHFVPSHTWYPALLFLEENFSTPPPPPFFLLSTFLFWSQDCLS